MVTADFARPERAECLEMPVPETPRRVTKFGLVHDGEGWFVANAREGPLA